MTDLTNKVQNLTGNGANAPFPFIIVMLITINVYSIFPKINIPFKSME